jgi:hypothetical protein
MVDAKLQDLRSLDRDVARAANALERWRGQVWAGAEDAVDDDPFGGVRYVAAKTTRDGLRELPVSAVDGPVRDGLLRWVGHLVLARLERDDDVALGEAANAQSIRFDGDEPRMASWREGWRELVASRNAGEARRWLEALAEGGPALEAVTRTRSARRLEVARRLGFSHPWEAEGRGLPGGRAALLAAARVWLEATDDLARAQRKEALREGIDAAAVLHLAMARTASEGWPARLTPRWFEDVFGAGPRGLPIRLGALPRAFGAASFARALLSFGRAVRIASAPSALPFAVARDPWQGSAHRLGAVFGALAADAGFHRVALGTGRRVAAAQARLLAGTALLEARIQAARVILGDDERPAPADTFDETTARLFGTPLDRGLRGAWPVPRADDPERFVAVLDAHPFRQSLRDRFDDDWFRNPRAWEALRSHEDPRAAPPAGADPSAALPTIDADAVALARAFEGALG